MSHLEFYYTSCKTFTAFFSEKWLCSLLQTPIKSYKIFFCLPILYHKLQIQKPIKLVYWIQCEKLWFLYINTFRVIFLLLLIFSKYLLKYTFWKTVSTFRNELLTEMGLTRHECRIQVRKKQNVLVLKCILQGSSVSLSSSAQFLADKGFLGAVCPCCRDGDTGKGLAGSKAEAGRKRRDVWKEWGQIRPFRPLNTMLTATSVRAPQPPGNPHLSQTEKQLHEHQLSQHSTSPVLLPSPFRTLLDGFFKNQPGCERNTSGYRSSSAQVSGLGWGAWFALSNELSDTAALDLATVNPPLQPG